ncbi:MAG: MFS transporter [Steroidobacteraceae bacterium]
MTGSRPKLLQVIAASSAGTAFEWYDFFVFGTLASTITRVFTGGNESAGFIFTLGAFAAGFFVRPFGAIYFGHIGDRYGRKRAFLQTIILMGVATTAIGLLPGIQSLGVAAPILLVLVRVVQGFAMGGEYGGAAVYVAEHADPSRRGLLTSWIQTTASVGLLLALGVVLGVRLLLGEEAFQQWGWRIPFLFSSALLGLSLWIRLRLGESPEFQRLQRAKSVSRAPLSEALRGSNLRLIGLALVSILLAQGAVWYTGHFYVQYFLERVLKVDARLVNFIVMGAVVLSSAGYLFFGWLSDRIGRKPVMLLGMGVAMAAYFPGFHALTENANPALAHAASASPVVVTADPARCRVQFDLLGRRPPGSACDVVRATLSDAGVPYTMADRRGNAGAEASISGTVIAAGNLDGLSAAPREAEIGRITGTLRKGLLGAGYPATAERDSMNMAGIVGVLLLFMLASTALYGPQAATLVELFPTSIRYTALSVPYNIGTGWVGGLLPVSAFALVAATGDIYSGLYYPLIFTGISFVCCWLWLPETRGRPLQSIGTNEPEAPGVVHVGS